MNELRNILFLFPLNNLKQKHKPDRMSIQLQSNSRSAWRKYLPSVHNAAIVSVTTATPAEPLKPEIYFLLLSLGAMYSDYKFVYNK